MTARVYVNLPEGNSLLIFWAQAACVLCRLPCSLWSVMTLLAQSLLRLKVWLRSRLITSSMNLKEQSQWTPCWMPWHGMSCAWCGLALGPKAPSGEAQGAGYSLLAGKLERTGTNLWMMGWGRAMRGIFSCLPLTTRKSQLSFKNQTVPARLLPEIGFGQLLLEETMKNIIKPFIVGSAPMRPPLINR